MNILIITSNQPQKTSGIVATDLKKALTDNSGCSVKILTRTWDKYDNNDIITAHSKFEEYLKKIIRSPKSLINYVRRRVFKLKPIKSKNTDPNYYVLGEEDLSKSYYSTSQLLKRIGAFSPDAIIVLFMTRFVNFKNLYELNKATNAPILLYLMDMAPMTGGCHYAWDCKGYQNQCGKCPAFFSDEENDQSRKNWAYKKEFIDKTDIIVLYGNEYLHNQIQKSSLLRFKPKFKVPLGIDHEFFKPGNKSDARFHFGLPENKKLIFIGASNIGSRRKGIKELMAALKILSDSYPYPNEIHVVTAGKGELLSDSLLFERTHLGMLNHHDLARAFQAADLFLCPSIEDTGPMMTHQSMMSGTPVVAFEMGAAIDMVITGETGYLAKLKDSSDLANGVIELLAMDEAASEQMRANCRDRGLAVNHYDKQRHAILKVLNEVQFGSFYSNGVTNPA